MMGTQQRKTGLTSASSQQGNTTSTEKQEPHDGGWWILKGFGRKVHRAKGSKLTSREAEVREACALVGIRYAEVPILCYRTVGLVGGSRWGGEIESYPYLVIVSNLVEDRRISVYFKWPRARGGV